MNVQDTLETQFSRLLPHDIEVEKCLLGALLIDPYAREQLLPADRREVFFQADHQAIYDVMRAMHTAGADIDGQTVRDALASRQLLEEIGGQRYLAELLACVPHAVHAPQYAAIVEEKALLRRMISVCNDALRDAYAPMVEGTASALAQRAMDELLSIITSGRCSTSKKLGEAARESLEYKQSNSTPRIQTGFKEFDDLTGGLRKGGMTVMAGRPGSGKSQTAKQIGLNVSRTGIGVAHVTIEEDSFKVADNLLSNQSGVENNRIAYNNLTADNWASLADAAGALKDLPFWIDDKSMSLSQVEAEICRRVVKDHCQLVIVDYLQLIDPDEDHAGTREQEVRKMSNSLKRLFKRLNVAGVVLAQLNRASGTERPHLHHLRESGSIEQDGDLIVLLHREDYFHIGEYGYSPTHKLEAIIGKNKDGQRGIVALHFDGAHQRISDWTGSTMSEEEMANAF